ncbi:hypothetical protein BC940DRAFT_288926 [Gongronella butleri]|nr:hypothetical protein BC940DRAFT_288926 [Gongronella butleri]
MHSQADTHATTTTHSKPLSPEASGSKRKVDGAHTRMTKRLALDFDDKPATLDALSPLAPRTSSAATEPATGMPVDGIAAASHSTAARNSQFQGTGAVDTNMSSLERLTRSMSQVNTAFQGTHEQFKAMKRVDASLASFNNAFGAFLFGLAANASSVQFANTPDESTLANYKDRLRQDGFPPRNSSTANATELAVESQRDTRPASIRRKPRPEATGRKFKSRVDIIKIIQHLPIKYREEVEPGMQMRTILRALRTKPDGLTKTEMTKEAGLPGYHVTNCLNVLVRSKDVIKYTQQGQLARFRLNPGLYPSDVE